MARRDHQRHRAVAVGRADDAGRTPDEHEQCGDRLSDGGGEATTGCPNSPNISAGDKDEIGCIVTELGGRPDVGGHPRHRGAQQLSTRHRQLQAGLRTDVSRSLTAVTISNPTNMMARETEKRQQGPTRSTMGSCRDRIIGSNGRRARRDPRNHRQCRRRSTPARRTTARTVATGARSRVGSARRSTRPSPSRLPPVPAPTIRVPCGPGRR